MAKVHVKVNDQVYVLSGKDRGMSGKVLAVFPDKGRIIVEGVNMITRHTKPRSRFQTGGIVHQEGTIDASNVMLVCEKCKRPSKVGRRILENGDKVRFCKACGETISTIRKAGK